MIDKAPPTTEKLRIAIDREGQGDKVDHPDPAAAPLGTDAEASGNSPTADELALERMGSVPHKRWRWGALAAYVVIAAVVFGAFLLVVVAT
ncbi:hypothetical protein [Pelagibacterium limicola]|uniref:hypothetical protein n=1 Tax=Pelagibacterium limicola TaxID=2791022 RepID=UPI0018AF553C|nr:hypothetical protein [Pelagibacterium limicola]